MSKGKLIDAMVGPNKFATKKEAEQAIEIVTDTIKSLTSAGDSVTIRGFGRFEVKKRAGRTGRHPGTGEEITIPAKQQLAFSARA